MFITTNSKNIKNVEVDPLTDEVIISTTNEHSIFIYVEGVDYEIELGLDIDGKLLINGVSYKGYYEHV